VTTKQGHDILEKHGVSKNKWHKYTHDKTLFDKVEHGVYERLF
jgi:hypothetical protein